MAYCSERPVNPYEQDAGTDDVLLGRPSSIGKQGGGDISIELPLRDLIVPSTVDRIIISRSSISTQPAHVRETESLLNTRGQICEGVLCVPNVFAYSTAPSSRY